jgi:hypothetical protein
MGTPWLPWRDICRAYERGQQVVSISYALMRIFRSIARTTN